MNYLVSISKKNMFTKILFSVAVLLALNFMIIRQGAEGRAGGNKEYKAYSSMIEKYPQILQGTTDFCENDNVFFWMQICREVLKKLQEIKIYKFLYLNYQFFNQNASEKCNERTVIVTNSVLLKKFVNLKPEMKHSMALCPSRDVIVPKYPTLMTVDYTRTVAITPDPNQINSVLVFIKNNENDQYRLFYYFEDLEYITYPHPDIYTLPAPTYTTTRGDFIEMYKNLHAVLTNRPNDTESNIVDQSSRFLFARLCLMTSKPSADEQNILNVGELCDKKPAAFAWKVSTYFKDTLANHELLIYPCSPPEEFVPPDSINAEVVMTKGQKLKQLYALSRGPDNNSLVLLRYKYIGATSMSLVITKFIENVRKEFLWEIHIPEKFKDRCKKSRHDLFQQSAVE